MKINTDFNKVNIVKFDRQTSFVAATVESFDIDKLKLIFITYDKTQPENNRIQKKIEIYLGLTEAVSLSHGILTKRIFTDWEKRKTSATGYIDPPFISRTGVCEKKAGRKDGLALSKQFIIEKMVDERTKENKYFFKALSGPGKSDAKGLIVPQYKNVEAEQTVNIVMKDAELEQFALMIRSAITGYHAKLALMGNNKFAESIATEIAAALKTDKAFINELGSVIAKKIIDNM